MSKALGKRCVGSLCGVLAAVLIMASTAKAEVTSDQSGSILVYPKVIWDGSRDTIIQMANTFNITVHAHCTYVNAAPANVTLPVSATNPPRWQLTDFDVWLTKEQPTHWVASAGRPVDPSDGFGRDGSGLDAGAVPPVPQGFTGELTCVEVDASGTPTGGNHLIGEAVLRDRRGDVSKHNAVAILGTNTFGADPSNQIRLDNPLTDDIQGEANSCYNALLLDHFVDGTPSPAIMAVDPGSCAGGNCPINTTLTLVPCSQDFEDLIPGRVTVQFEITDEMEVPFSTSTTVDCWLDTPLSMIGNSSGTSIFTVAGSNGSTGTMFTKIKPVDMNGGVIGIAEEIHHSSGAGVASAAWNLQGDGQLADGNNNFINGRFFPVTRYEATNGACNLDTDCARGQTCDGNRCTPPVVDVITLPPEL